MVNTDMVEGVDAWTRFREAVGKALEVPHSVIQQRIQEHREQAAQNPRKRGPKRKTKPSASPDSAV